MSNIASVTKSMWVDVVEKSRIPVLVDFWAEWCGPCRALSPILDELSQRLDGKVTFVKVNIEQESELCSKFNVRSIPTMLVFKNGQLDLALTGLQSKQSILMQLEGIIGEG